MSDSCHEYFILCQPIRECALYRRHVFHASEWLADEELKEGTILVKDQSKETYTLTDRKEIQIGSDVEGLDDKLVQLSNTDAEQLLKITSLEKRYRLFMRLEEQRQKERKELDFGGESRKGALRAREKTSTGGSDGRTTEWHFNRSLEEEEKQQEWLLQRQKLEDKLKDKEDYIDQLNTKLSEKEEKTDETTMRQRIDNLERQLLAKEERETTVNSALQEMEKQKGDVERQLGMAEEKLRNCQAELSTTTSRLHKQLREKEDQEETVRIQFVEIERLRGQLAEKETRETGLREQLGETRQQSESVQRQLREMERKFTEKEEREDNLRTQLRGMEQRFREETTEKETRETGLREQLKERNQREANVHIQLREMEQQLTEKEEQEENLRRQLREMEQQWTNFQLQYREREVENADLRRQVSSLEGQLKSLPHDWFIPRDEIQMTDNCLGRGAWATVFEGRYCGCAVAVKQIHHVIDSPQYRRLFVREIDIASRCRHPCLLQFIGATNDEETPVLVTELMEISLRYLLGQRRLSPTEISVISLDVARALNYLHQKRPVPIIHRDISSANVLLWRQAGRQDGNQEGQWRGKVSDYGTAKFREQVMTIGPGCPVYSAPEASTTNQTVKIDIYSFGVLLCEMCVRDPPEHERRDEQVAMMTDHVLQALVRRCLQFDPRDRPDMVEIINELEQFYQGERL